MSWLIKLTVGIFLMIWSILGAAKDYPVASLGTEDEDGFVDLTLSIAKYEKQKNGVARFLIQNTLNGKKIGFVVELQPTWKAQQVENADAYFYWGSAEILSTGEESNSFLSAISKLYGLTMSKPIFAKKIMAEVVGLANDPMRIENEPIKMKFFFNSNSPEDLYSEVFINVDLNKRILEFNEKDPEYRGALVKSLAK